jgi:tRNA (guanine37-N1)-methyltransferase
MVFDILTIFPNSFSAIQESIVKRAVDNDLVRINIWDLRKWTDDPHHSVDDKPFGGGAGMVMKIRPIYRALKDLGVYPARDKKTKIWLTSAKGKMWDQELAKKTSEKLDRIVLLCGHYEGVDHRVVEHLIDEEISIGEYILSGGEIPAMVIVDSISRLIPGVLGNQESLNEETSFDEGKLLPEYPQYTRPAIFTSDENDSWNVPEVLLSGDHAKIEKWKEGKRKDS